MLPATHAIIGTRIVRKEPLQPRGGRKPRIRPADAQTMRYRRLILGEPISELARSYAIPEAYVSLICSFKRLGGV